MGPSARREYIADMRPRYAAAAPVARSALLDQVVAATGYHRKYAIALLGGPEPPARANRRRRGPRCSASVIAALVSVWRAADYPWSVRLKAMLPLWLPALRTHAQLTEREANTLVGLSPRTMDRLLGEYRGLVRRTLYGRTRPGTLLKHQIPIRSERWADDIEPGWAEADCVSHSGPLGAGEFAYSVNATDIASCWTETRAIQGKSCARTVGALDQIRESLPFRLKGLDSDSGGEFINANLVRWCQQNDIKFTRSRPYRKNDNAHVEQKNFTHVRRVFGWKRLAGDAIVQAMNELYASDLRVWMNYFQPSVKLVSRERVGARVRRKYDPPRTPLDRLIALGALSEEQAQAMLAQRSSIDPFELGSRIEVTIKRILAMPVPPAEPYRRHGPGPLVVTANVAYVNRAASGAPVRIPVALSARAR